MTTARTLFVLTMALFAFAGFSHARQSASAPPPAKPNWPEAAEGASGAASVSVAPAIAPVKSAIDSATDTGTDPATGGATEGNDAEATAAGSAESDEARKQAEEAKAKAEKEKIRKARLGKIKKLNFDRRASSILKLWADPDAEDDDGAADGGSSASTTGVPAAGASSEMDPVTASRLLRLGYVTSGSVTISAAPSGVVLAGPEVTGEAISDMTGAVAVGAGTAEVGAAGTAAAEPDPFDELSRELVKVVTLGDWIRVREILAEMTADDEEVGKAAYARMLTSLKVPPKPKNQRNAKFGEKNVFSFDDIMGMIAAAPVDLDKDSIASLGVLLGVALDSGSVVEGIVSRMKAEVDRPQDVATLDRREAAKILFAGGQPVAGGEFLPDLDTAIADEDHEAMNLLSRWHLARHAKDSKPVHLENAWHVLQALFVSGEIEREEKEEALTRAVELAPKIEETLGQAWLEESFTSRPERGMEIIAAIGSAASRGHEERGSDAAFRLKGLQLQNTAVEALLASAPERAQEWRLAVGLLAGNWLKEAVHSYSYDQSTSRGPRLQRDPFGNFFYYDMNNQNRGGRVPVQAIATGELLDIRPGDAWLDLVDDGARPKYAMLYAQLLLKVNEEDEAFPFIEQLADTHPQQAEALVNEFLRVWTRNHDPNSQNNRTNMYMFMYGFDRRAAGIPLTRSKQERNLAELTEWVRRLRALPIDDPDVELLARAFTTCHSSAEVYKLEAIEQVFGSLDTLEPAAIAEMIQRMRLNLVGIWRQPANQKDKKTRRKQKDIEAEVLRGYAVARAVLEDARSKHQGEWALHLAKAAIDHDELMYRQEMAKSSDYSSKRGAAFREFETAAALYADTVGDLAEHEQSTRVYDQWFYAALGACDLQEIREYHLPDLKQIERIREAIVKLPRAAADNHMAMFANNLFTRMSSVNPIVKYRYLRSGFSIVGDHKRAHEARKVYEYYDDLVTEIELETVIDGSDRVGRDEPFGLFVNLRHTREIEREAGGFGRYLQNQNNVNASFNYGRPTENYRDKFEDTAREALEEHFEVLSVTFQSEDVHSRADERDYGWRVTPYAYVLLRPLGPEIDTIPSLRLDLDFLDTSGYAVLPIESPEVPIDASAGQGEARPFRNLAITQTLDERQAEEGKLILEIKASADGLVPALDDILEVDSKGFEIVQTDDEGVSVVQFSADSEEVAVVSERSWMLTLGARDDLAELPDSFTFGEARTADASIVYQRYLDADLLEVEPEVSLEERYGERRRSWAWIVVALVVIGGGGTLFLLTRKSNGPQAEGATGRSLPDSLTAFTVLGFLRDLDRNNGIRDSGRQELHRAIRELERQYFREGDAEQTNLRAIAEEWARKADRN